MSLTAPAHLRGSLNGAHLWIRERNTWVLDAVSKGHTEEEMVAALGISLRTIREIKRRLGIRKRKQGGRKPHQLGVYVGMIGPMIEAMPDKPKNALFRQAERSGKPMSAVLADFWAQHHGAQA